MQKQEPKGQFKWVALLLLVVTLMMTVPREVHAVPTVSNIVVTEEYYSIRVDYRLTTVGDYQTAVFEEDVLVLSKTSVPASNQDRWVEWDKRVTMRGLQWAIRLTDTTGTRWVNGTYEQGADLVTVHGVSVANETIAFHVSAILECDVTAYRNADIVYSGHIGANYVTFQFIRNGSLGTHTYNISFVQTRFVSHTYAWQLDHSDIIAEEIVVSTVTVTVTVTVLETVTVTELVTVTVTEVVNATIIETIIVNRTEFVTVTEYITVPQIVTVPLLQEGVGMVSGAAIGILAVVLVVLLRGKNATP